MKKKILIFSTAYYPFVGGAEVAVKEITDLLSEDFQFDLICAKFQKDLPASEKIGAVTVYRIGIGKPIFDKLLLPFSGAIKVWKLQKENSYFCFWSVMVSFAGGAGYICNIFRSIIGRKKIPMVLTLQEGDSESHLKYKWAGLINLSWKVALKRTDFLTAISNFLLRRAEMKGYSGHRAIVPNGVNMEIFSQSFSDVEKEKMKNLLGKKNNDIFLITSSRLSRKNAVDDIISSLLFLPKNFSLIVVGKGEEGKNLQKQVDILNLSDRVKFLGFVRQDDIPKIFSVCDIFVRPSRSEGFGNSFIEAMAARLPVIATPVGGIPDFIDDKETGIFCSPDNPKSVAEAIRFLVDNPELKWNIIDKAFERVGKKYSWDHIAEEMKETVFGKI